MRPSSGPVTPEPAITEGVTIAGARAALTGNFIGVLGNGLTVEPNRGDGVLIQSTGDSAVIGRNDGTSFALSNLISGNWGNGITIDGAGSATVAANQIGTDASGRIPLGNRGHGIRLTNGAADNLVGGAATGGNNPTSNSFARPPQGNLISANRGCGVGVDTGASGNAFSGNFIGTTASGNAPLGNWQDGIAIVDADGNRLIGTTAARAAWARRSKTQPGCRMARGASPRRRARRTSRSAARSTFRRASATPTRSWATGATG